MASYGSNAIQGAGTGAAAGAAFGPWGALIGGGVGLAAGLFSAWEQEQDEKKKQQILEQAARQLNTSTENLKALAARYYEENPSTGRKEDVNKYRELIDTYDPNEFVYDAPEFEDNFDVNDYYAANKDAIIDKTADAIQARAAGQGVGRGTGAANAIATGVAEKNEELYKDAFIGVDKLFWLPTYLTRENPNLPIISPREFFGYIDNPTVAVEAEANDTLAATVRELIEKKWLVVLITAGPADTWFRNIFKN